MDSLSEEFTLPGLEAFETNREIATSQFVTVWLSLVGSVTVRAAP